MPPSNAKNQIRYNKLKKRLRREVGKAIEDYNLIEEGDRIMVCLSGGKDSYTMLSILTSLQRNAPIKFDLTAVNLDQKQPGYPQNILPDYLSTLGIDYHIIEQDTYSIVKRIIPEGKTMCGLCSRLRRGILYRFAKEHGFRKIALGHHREDLLETLFLNMFNGGRLSTMPPKLKSDDGDHLVIRPLVYCREKDIAEYAQHQGFPIIPCTLCGSQGRLQRVMMKEMLKEWEKKYPGRLENISKSLSNVVPSHLADSTWFDFHNLTTSEHEAADKTPLTESWLSSEKQVTERYLKSQTEVETRS